MFPANGTPDPRRRRRRRRAAVRWQKAFLGANALTWAEESWMASALLPSARSARTSGPVGISSATRSCPSPVTLTCTYAIY